MLANKPQLTMDGKGLNHWIQINRATILCLSEDANLSIEVSKLLILLFAIRLEISIINIEHFDGNDLVAALLSTEEG